MQSSHEAETWNHPGGKLLDRGSASLTQAELLAVVIGSGVPGRPAIEIADAVLDEYGGLYGILKHGDIDGLSQISGLGVGKAKRIFAALVLGNRVHLSKGRQPSAIPSQNLFDEQITIRYEPDEEEMALITDIIGSGIMGSSSKDIARELIEKHAGAEHLFGKDLQAFLSVRGLDTAKVIRIVAALEIASRIDKALA